MNERDRQEYEEEIDLLELFWVLLEHWKWIVLSTLIAAIVGFSGSKMFLTPQYEATVDMIVNSRQDLSGNLTNDNITSARNLIGTYAIILTSNTVLDEVIEELELEKDYLELSEQISVEAVDTTQVMRVSVQDPDPEAARSIVEKISQIAPDVIVDAVQAGSCKVISKVSVSEEPVSPNNLKNTILVSLAGMVIACGVIFLKFILRRYIKDDTDVQKYLDLPVLGVIPELEEEK